MANNDFPNERSETNEPRWLCVFVIDVSTSMSDEALRKINEELHNFYRFVKNDEIWGKRIEMCIITSGQGVRVIQEPNPVNFFDMPQITRGIDQAIELAIARIEERKQWYNEMAISFYRPLLVLVTQEAKEELFENQYMKNVKNSVEWYLHDFLNLGMDGSNLYAHSTDLPIRLKAEQSILQLILPLYFKSKVLSYRDKYYQQPFENEQWITPEDFTFEI